MKNWKKKSKTIILNSLIPMTNMTTMTDNIIDQGSTMSDNIIDRDELQDQYICSLINTMSTQDLKRFMYESLSDNLDKYSLDEIIDEVEYNFPELLDDRQEGNITEPGDYVTAESSTPDESTGWN